LPTRGSVRDGNRKPRSTRVTAPHILWVKRMEEMVRTSSLLNVF
jgi:hypothetical protein